MNLLLFCFSLKFKKKKMVAHPKQSGNVFKLLSLLVGILVGCLYANFGRSIAKQWLSSHKMPNVDVTTVDSIARKVEVNETARFLVSDDTNVADTLAKAIKVLCWVHESKLEKDRIDAIKNTWGARCTQFITITSSGQNSTNIFNIPNGVNGTSNIENAYRFIYSQYSNKFDWFLKTSHSLYVVMENLRFKLFEFDANDGVAVGLALTNKQNLTYLSDKAGYAVNALGLKKLVNGFQSNSCPTSNQIKSDELRIGFCLKKVGVHFGNSTDQHGKKLFFEKYLDNYLLPNENVTLPYPWYQDYKVNHNLEHASNYSITFCDLNWQQMHTMEFLIYQLRPYGIETTDPILPEKVSIKK